MSLGAGFRSIYDEIKNLRIKSKEPSNLQSMPNINLQRQQQTVRRTQSRDRSSISMWREARCCCQQRVNESERIRRKVSAENAELRRLCIYLDDQRQQAFHELMQWRSDHQIVCADPTCCGSNYQCSVNASNSANQESGSLITQQNDELLSYIRSLEDRIMTLEEGKTSIHRNGILLGKTRYPVRSVSQQHSPVSSQCISDKFTLQQPMKDQQRLLDSLQSTLTDSSTMHYNLDEDNDEENSAATTVYVATKRASNATNNFDNFSKQAAQHNDHPERSTLGLVKKFLSTRESFIQALRKRNELVNDLDYAVIKRKHNNAEWSESSDLPPSLPELIMKRKFTSQKPMNKGVQLTRQIA